MRAALLDWLVRLVKAIKLRVIAVESQGVHGSQCRAQRAALRLTGYAGTMDPVPTRRKAFPLLSE
jgi:hypothetical protein